MHLPLLFLLVLLSATYPAPSRADPSGFGLCRSAIAAAERASGIPDRLMQAIGVVESGRPDERGVVSAWPWTINVEGVGYSFDSKREAIDAVAAHRARGARSIDVGCMQVNLIHHGDAFASLEQAFDPVANARYAADFLQRLLAQTGSWPRAAAGYHSMTAEVGADYARKVLAVWARPNLGTAPGEPIPRRGDIAGNYSLPASALTVPTSGSRLPTFGGISLPGSMTARVLPVGSPTVTSAPVGRGLAAYRALPTRLATGFTQPRG